MLMNIFWLRFLFVQLVVACVALLASDGGGALGLLVYALLTTNGVALVMANKKGFTAHSRVAVWMCLLPVFELLLIFILLS